MNQYEAAYQDTKPTRIERAVTAQEKAIALEDIFRPLEEAEKAKGDKLTVEIPTPDERHFFPVMTKTKTVYEVIYGVEDHESDVYSDWDTAYGAAKAIAKSTSLCTVVTIQVTEDKEYTVG